MLQLNFGETNRHLGLLKTMPHYADLSVDNIGGNMKLIAARESDSCLYIIDL
jgi:hypothetical protein